MDCREYELIIPAYAAGDLPDDRKAGLLRHIDSCPQCRRALGEYELLVDVIQDEPMLLTSAQETEAMSAALARVSLPEPEPARKDHLPQTQGLFGFAMASVAAFMIITLVLARGTASLQEIIFCDPVNMVKLLGSLMVVVFLTSFIPIVVTARRRPLNGMTFRR